MGCGRRGCSRQHASMPDVAARAACMPMWLLWRIAGPSSVASRSRRTLYCFFERGSSAGPLVFPGRQQQRRMVAKEFPFMHVLRPQWLGRGSWRARKRGPEHEHGHPCICPSSQHPAASTQQQAPSTLYPAASSQQPAPSTEKPTPSTQTPTPSTLQPAPSTQATEGNGRPGPLQTRGGGVRTAGSGHIAFRIEESFAKPPELRPQRAFIPCIHSVTYCARW